MTIVIRKKMILIFAVFLGVVFSFGFFATSLVNTQVATPLGITIVLDAGHGGLDGGSVGTTTGVTEREINLEYAKTLTKYLEDFGFNVVNTRTDTNGLYGNAKDDYKLVDMQNRAKIINGSDAQILVSIHMNKFTDSSENGAQVFFEQNNENSQKLAESIRDILIANFDNARKLVLPGDYYILNNTEPIGVIVECGFLSNPNEEKLLQEEAYRNKICYSIYCGIINYLGLSEF